MGHKDYDLMDLDDGLHYDGKSLFGHNKPFSFCISEREAGKSTLGVRTFYNNWVKTGEPALVVKRQVVDITTTYIEDFETLIHKFISGKRKPKLSFNKGDISQGIVDVKIDGETFIRIIALSLPLSRLKSYVLRNIKWMLVDEFLVNLKLGEKYLKGEDLKLKELYTTYNRESEKSIRIMFMGNPYSVYCPYFTWLGIRSRDLKRGKIISGDNWVIECYDLKPELRTKILEKNPLYQFDDSYGQYFREDGSVGFNDSYIPLVEKEPKGFSLYMLFKLDNNYIGVWRASSSQYRDRCVYGYWARRMNADEYSKKRKVFAFQFGDMNDDTIIMNKLYGLEGQNVKLAMEARNMGFKDIETNYMLEEIYENL